MILVLERNVLAVTVPEVEVAASSSTTPFDPRAGRRELLGVKTWLSTLETVNLS